MCHYDLESDKKEIKHKLEVRMRNEYEKKNEYRVNK
jgi:hypothetical protein